MTADQERDEIIEELRTGLREQQSMLAAQTERITLLEGERRSPSTARPREDESPERRPRRLTRGGMLKAAAMGAIGLAGAEAASTLGRRAPWPIPVPPLTFGPTDPTVFMDFTLSSTAIS